MELFYLKDVFSTERVNDFSLFPPVSLQEIKLLNVIILALYNYKVAKSIVQRDTI